jgi:hypothetical protein
MKEDFTMKWIHIILPMLFISASFAYSGSLQGTVRDAQSLIPIVGVNVTVHVVNPDSVALPTTTDQNGTYSVTGIIPGNKVYAVVTHTNGYVMSYARIDNLGSLDLVYDIYLTPESGMPPVGGSDSSAVLGTIMTPSTDNRSLMPVANAQVRLVSGNQQFDAVTNSEGKYTKNISLGLYFVTVSADGYNNLTTTGVQVAQTGATVNAILQTTAVGILQNPEQSQPERFALVDAYPNPFNPSTTISFILLSKLFVSLKVFDVLGREVATLVSEELSADAYTRQWNAAGIPSGVYFYRLQAGSFTETKKLVLLK